MTREEKDRVGSSGRAERRRSWFVFRDERQLSGKAELHAQCARAQSAAEIHAPCRRRFARVCARVGAEWQQQRGGFQRPITYGVYSWRRREEEGGEERIALRCGLAPSPERCGLLFPSDEERERGGAGDEDTATVECHVMV
ncbi:hypothetical protein CBR_g12193 [Chara braunii]|uniref:Uncharacterized protein n=1 Tax=Chara braunii TaxID=69332 RepID=A0A388KRC4_CHABU|nr:hypothetical protein CBR_g12193 [Chara braunii]|eukprot:GBG72620.1 hypothetical protein CBR_g12193 [Chara braunii]